MAAKLVLAAVLLFQVIVQVSTMEPYLYTHQRTTRLFRECEEELNYVDGEPYYAVSETGRTARRFAPANRKNIKWTEIHMRNPKSFLRCMWYEENTYGNSTMLRYEGNRCYRTDDPPYSLDEDEETCADNPSGVVYLLE